MNTLGRYELVRPLARGGMADVYLARRKVAGVEKRLVIKRMRRERVADPRALDLFVKEAQLSMSLVQQNIVPVFDFGRIGEDVFLAMEHVDGKDVGSTLARSPGQPVAPVLAAFIAAECCAALDHAHQFSNGSSRGIVHRDVTPRNILLSWSGDVKLADFGIAAVVGDAQRGIIGTPAYMAPEQARGDEVDGRADIYALGLVLWELLIGSRVRAGDDRNAMVAAARNNELPACTNATVPEPLRRIVMRATATAPADRFVSARDMLEALDIYIVAARAASAEGSPRNAITAWLALTWQGEQDATGQTDIAEPGVIVTFLDDGVAGVLGTATQHSVAVTADDEPVPPSLAPSLAAAPSLAPDPAASRVAEPSTATTAGVTRTSASRPGTSRARIIMVVSAMSIATLAGVFAAGRTLGKRNIGDAAAPSVAPAIDAANMIPAISRDAASTFIITPDALANLDATSPVTGHFDAPPLRKLPRLDARTPRDAPARSTTDDATKPAVAALPRVQFGAKPWAYVVIDGQSAQLETPATIELTVGSHLAVFTNPALGAKKTLTINVVATGDNRFVVDLLAP